VLQPPDLEYTQFVPQLKNVSDELVIVRRNDFVELLPRVMSLLSRIGRQVLSRFFPMLRLFPGGARGQLMGLDGHCWPATIRAVALAARRRSPDMVVSEYAFFTRCFAKLPRSTIRVVDTVEVFSRNTSQFAEAGVAPNLVCDRDSESMALGRADLVIAIQSDDAKFLRDLIPEKRVIIVGHVYPEARSRAIFPRRGVVLFVASRNEYNRHGLEMFIREAWPTIRKASPDATLQIVGDVRSSSSATYEAVDFVGRVSDQKLAEYYQTAHVVINPQVAGTGLKIKCVEALSAGCPLVVNEAGADGLRDGAGKAFWVAHSWDDFAGNVVRLLQNDAVRLRLEAEARRFAADKFSKKAVFAELENFLDEHLGHRR
jgi:glycosyltransferase involved in cell wall biosynthesis